MSSTITALTSGGGLAMAGDTSGQLELKTNNGSTAVTISTAQKVGIGVAPSGSYILEVNGNPNFNSVGGVYLTCGSYDAIKNPSGNILAFGGVTASQWDTTALYTSGTERMRIDSSGKLFVGTTTDGATGSNIISNGAVSVQYVGNSTLYRQLYYSSNNNFYFSNGSNQPYISSTGTWTNASDARLKDNIVDIKYGLADVLKMQPRSYEMKSNQAECVGFIAQELQNVIPECVSGDEEHFYGVDYGTLAAVLTKAIQELNAKVEAQALEIKALKGVA